jgi:hypothetical protein
MVKYPEETPTSSMQEDSVNNEAKKIKSIPKTTRQDQEHELFSSIGIPIPISFSKKGKLESS